jgi:hypothetical protein
VSAKKRKPSLGASAAPQPPLVAYAWNPGIAPVVLTALAMAYLGAIAFDGMGSSLPRKLMPRAAAFFSQCSCLFPNAADVSIDYRAEGYRCDEKRWVEIDPRPFFPIDRDEKESRFQRTLHFYKEDRATMQALEAFLMARQNEEATAGRSPLGGGPIAGVRFLSLRIPFGKPGDPVPRYAYRPLAEFPVEQRHNWYWTPQSKRNERCGVRASDAPKEPVDP